MRSLIDESNFSFISPLSQFNRTADDGDANIRAAAIIHYIHLDADLALFILHSTPQFPRKLRTRVFAPLFSMYPAFYEGALFPLPRTLRTD